MATLLRGNTNRLPPSPPPPPPHAILPIDIPTVIPTGSRISMRLLLDRGYPQHQHFHHSLADQSTVSSESSAISWDEETYNGSTYTTSASSSSSNVAIRTLKDPEEGIYEYVEEKHRSFVGGSKHIPIRLNGWMWRREGFFRKYRRRFCVFKANCSTLFIFANDNTVNGKLLRRLVLTQVKLVSRSDRVFNVQGYLLDKEIHKKQSDSMAKRKTSLATAMPGDQQRFFLAEEEQLRAVSAKAMDIWAHCFKHHMKSYSRRRKLMQKERTKRNKHQQQQQDDEEAMVEYNEDEELDPDFTFEEDSFQKQQYTSVVVQRMRQDPLPVYLSNAMHRSSRLLCSSEPNHPSLYQLTNNAHGYSGTDDYRVLTAKQYGEQDLNQLRSVSPISVASCSSSSLLEDDALAGHRVDFGAIKKHKQLQRNGSHEIWLAYYRSQPVVIKRLNEHSIHTNHRNRRELLRRFVREIKLLSRLDHCRIVGFLGVAWTVEENVQLMLEFLPKGELRAFLDREKHERRSIFHYDANNNSDGWTKHQWRIAVDIIEGLVYLHSQHPAIIHSGLTSKDVLLCDDLHAKLAGFGSAHQVIDHNQESFDTHYFMLERLSSNSSCSSISGTASFRSDRWKAPELLTGSHPFSMASDVYAFGVILSEIDTNELPFHERMVLRSGLMMREDVLLHHIITETWMPTFRVECPLAIQELARDCLAADPTARPTSVDVAYRLRRAASECGDDIVSRQTAMWHN